jgi:CO/xanthine dehydrogenase Mo-binding subunit
MQSDNNGTNGRPTQIGRRQRRADSPERLTGRTRFANDLVPPGALYTRFVRSPYASATIVSVDTSAAKQVPGVVGVLTARDLPIPNPEAASEARDILLAFDRVMHVGQPVVAVLAETEGAAEDAAELVNIEYDPLQPVVDFLEALSSSVPVLRNVRELSQEELAMHGAATATDDEAADPTKPNIASRTKFERGDLAAGFDRADVVIEREYHTRWVSQGYLEPQSCTVGIDPLGNLEVYASTQALFHTRATVCRVLGLSEHQVTVTAMPVGGGFGGKFGFLEPTVAALAMAVHRPVRVVLSRQEEFSTADPAPESRMRIKLGATRDGTMTALEGEMVFDSGAKAGSAPVGIAGILMGSLYRFGSLQIRGVEVVTHKASTGAYRAPGAPQAAFALESTIDELARQLNMDPVELRIKNAVAEGDVRADGATWTRIGLAECLEQARTVYAAERAGLGPNEGVGIAAGGWPGATDAASAVCRLNGDGSLQVTTGTVDLTGTNTTFAIIAAEVFGMTDSASVRVNTADTDSAPYVGGTGGSKVTYTIGPAVLKAAQDARDQVLHIAASELEAAVEDLELVDGQISVKGVPSKSLSLSDVYKLSTRGSGSYVPVLGRGQTVVSDHSPGMAVHIARVRVDPDTGKVVPLHYVAIQDVGRAINPALIEDQMHGGAVQGVGWGLYEQIIFDEQGTPITGSFMDYTLPKASQSPDLDTVLVQVPSILGPFGAKGVGEPPVIPGPAAWANAVRDACGARITELPLTPERVWQAIDSHNRS